MKKILLMLACILCFTTVAFANAPQKFKVAVGDLIISDGVSQVNTKLVNESSLLTSVENALRNGRKFDVLSRRQETLDAVLKEQEFAKSSLSAGNAANAGKLLNAQGIIQIEVLEFAFWRSANAVPRVENKFKLSDFCSISLNVKVVDSQTASILASFPIKAQSSSGTFVANQKGYANKKYITLTVEKAAATLADSLADSIYPITVIAVRNGQFWVNRGNDSGMKVGNVFEVFQPGEELIDPFTGENLGSTETLIGRGKVVRVNPKSTILEMSKGDFNYIQPGFILRRPVK